MTDEPYRPAAPDQAASPELERLVREGQQRLSQQSAQRQLALAGAGASARTAAERNIRVALGGYYGGSPVRVVAVGLIVVGGLAACGAFAWAGALVLAVPSVTLGIVLRIFAPPVGTRSRVAAEQAWLASVPFVLEGYFELLGQEPQGGCHLRVAVTWGDAAAAPGDDTTRAALAVVDTAAVVKSRTGATVVVRSGSISGRTNLVVGDQYVHRNTGIVRYVHDLVDRVLLPLHRSSPIARVSLTRD